MSNTDRLLQQALTLPEDEREHLAHELLGSLGDASRLEHEDAWMAEVQRRRQQVERGEVKLVPAEQALRRARERLAKLHG